MPPILTPQSESFPRWYQDVVAKAELAENGPVRGTMVIRPWAFSIWERLQRAMDDRIKQAGAENAYFPLLIPEAFMHREAEHVEGFSPELAVVTIAGGKELEEPIVVRPTSETIINHYFARWISSYRDLPLLINQWGNVVRWELRTRLFLRTTEFLWQEGHTAHRTALDAQDYALRILTEVYSDAMESELAIPVYRGLKTDREKFAGALRSWSCEAVMRDGKALQMGTSHELGQNFAEAFDISFTDEDGESRRPWQTSWGASSRLLGAMIMVHGDDQGLRVPPRLAGIQVVVLIARAGEGVAEAAGRLLSELTRAGVRAHLDDRTDVSTGRRIIDWELKGVPLRLEIGPRDLQQGQAVLARRIPGTKEPIAMSSVAETVPGILQEDQVALFEEAARFRDGVTVDCQDLAEAAEAAKTGFGRIPWSNLGTEGEHELAKAGVSVRCLIREDGERVTDIGAPGVTALVARAY